MAVVQVGASLGRVILLVGFTGSILIRNGRLSEFLGELQEVLGEKGNGGDALHAQIQRQVDDLAREIRSILAPTVVHIDSGNSVMSALLAPAAVAGVLGYGYMRWKGISFSSLMYVTKKNMANAVSSMTKHLEQVQSSLAAAKKHLTERIQRVDDKLDQQKKISGEIRDEVTAARLKLENIGSELRKLKEMTSNLDWKLDSIQDKQDCQLAGVSYLLKFVEEEKSNDGKRLQHHQAKLIQHNAAAHLEGLKQRPVVSRSGKQGELPGLQFGLRLLALEESANRGALLHRSTMVNPAC